jgi:quinoprotein relay system zinc metallohydrolase 1
MKRRLLTAGLAAAAALAPPTAQPQTPGHAPAPVAQAAALDYALAPRQIAARTWVIEGAVDDFRPANGCNIINTGFIATGAGVVVINTGPSRRYGEQQRRAIERVTAEPVVLVLNLNLHPDYFFGNQAWADRPTAALPGSIAGMTAEGESYANNLYRLCGEWMAGTSPIPAREAAAPRQWQLGAHRLELLRLDGHTGDDLVLRDLSTGVVFAGGLVFAQRVPTTPHADIARWLASLQQLDALLPSDSVVVPSHGPVHRGTTGLAQTRDWLLWARDTMARSADQGLDIGELMRQPLPDRFAGWAAQPAEWHRTLAALYPAFEARALLRSAPRQ